MRRTECWFFETSPFARYFIATLASILTVGTISTLDPILSHQNYFIPLAVVTLVSLFCGWGPGLVNLSLTVLGQNFFLLAPIYTFEISGKEDRARQILFFFIGLLVCIVSARLRDTLRRMIQLAKQLQAKERELRIVLDSVPAMIWYKDKENRILRCNQRAAATKNMTVEEMEGRATSELYPDEAGQYWADDLAVINSRKPNLGIIERHQTGTGEKIWVQVNKVPYINENNESIGVLVFAIDITPLKKAEEERDRLLQLEKSARLEAEKQKRLFEALLLDAPAIVTVHRGPELTYEFVNPLMAQFLGKNVIGLSVKEAFPDLEKFGFLQKMLDVYRTGHSFVGRQIPYLLKGPDGIEREAFFDITYQAFKNADGKIEGLMSFAYDVTSQVQARQSVEVALKKLEVEKELRQQFVSTLTHDLRNPLQAAKSSTEILIRHWEKPDARTRLLPMIVTSLERADRMIRDLLDANYIQAGQKLPLPLAEFDLRSLTELTLEELALIHGDHFIFDCKEPVWGFWSKDGLRRILENLLSNAIKYGAPDGPVKISIVASEDDVEVQVQNRGNELTPEQLTVIFQPFRRTGSAQKSGKKGWGLGLTLVSGLVAAHGGKVTVESNPAQGTTFCVRLPWDSRPFQEGNLKKET